MSFGQVVKGFYYMDIKAVFFDLDGTLLPMDQDVFVEGYFKLLAKKLYPLGFDPQMLIKTIWAGTEAMVVNDGSRFNEEVFWEKYSGIFGEKAEASKPMLEEFYTVDFQAVRSLCGFNPDAKKTIDLVKSLGLRTVLATNPIFPHYATESRIRWAGLEPSDFEFYTSYETSKFSKPNPKYFLETAERAGISPAQCLMVGNDATEDLAAAETGMKVFILTDCLINKHEKDLSQIPHGGFSALWEYLKTLVSK